MATFDELKSKHLRYLARAAVLGNNLGKDHVFLQEVRAFIRELTAFLQERTREGPQRRAQLQLYRNRWIELTQTYR